MRYQTALRPELCCQEPLMMPSATSHGQSATNGGRVDAGVGCNPWAERRTGPQCQHKQFSRDSARGVRTLGKDPLISPHPQSGRDPDSRALPILDLSGPRGRGQGLNSHLKGEMSGTRRIHYTHDTTNGCLPCRGDTRSAAEPSINWCAIQARSIIGAKSNERASIR